ncbi:Branched-chain amino acid transport system permease protein LivM [Euzebya pacifica]|jgi:branched-chain amino acid transport system permease protein|uniref:Branched-chain amino acid transport system permease protein LivM n=1 Tax=Euzebya pacifica TaxID=1608957 RepID=A0A346XRL0_9ACTN|nr:branched-chain amino acid ABC transporter permease [Euzebya pacifica]AXV04857.1 Branched-chain amino acid transport system permease protein LivM [Euzebya pacifica]
MTDTADTADTAVQPTSPAAAPLPASRSTSTRGGLIALVVVAVLVALPFVGVPIPGVLPGEISSPGSLQVLAIGLVFAGIAVSYDIVFGFTGLLSFGHALFVALGAYGTNLLMESTGLPYAVAVPLTVVLVAVIAALLGGVALRVGGVAFAMVTLAYAEVFSILLLADPLRISGGEEGLALVSDGVPDLLRGVVNIRNRYWLALVFLVVAYVIARMVTASRAGRVWEAIRENEDRVELLGLKPLPFKLVSFVIGASLATLGGGVYLLLVRGANPSLASADFTLALLVMVVLGGAGRLWGAAIGGMLYGLLTLRLSALGTSGVLDGLPDPIEGVLSEPLFVLGTLFVLLMLFAPGGMAGISDRLRSTLRRADGAAPTTRAPGTPP